MKLFWHRRLTIRYGDVKVLVAVYMLLPLVLFLGGFVRWYFAIPGIVAALFCVCSIIRHRSETTRHKEELEMRISSVIALFVLMLLWTQFGGMNGYMYQSSDWPERNAVFRDLIFHRWPVIYEASNSALVYYVGHWLPVAIVGKLVLVLTRSARLAWFVGRMALWGWSSVGLTMLALLVFFYIGATTRGKRIMALVVLVFFSGLDIIGTIIYDKGAWLFSPEVLHLEWWPEQGNQYTSITACLYWVFNQTIIPWLATMCFLLDTDERDYVFYGAACLVSGPLPFVGLSILMVVRATGRLVVCVRQGIAREWLREVLSPGNIAVALLIVPIVTLYLSGNGSFAMTKESTFTQEQGSFLSAHYWNKDLFLFYILEVGVYLTLVWNDHKRDLLFYCIALLLICIPYFHVGEGTDFCMRASMPAVFILMCYVADYIIHYFMKLERPCLGQREKRICVKLLVLVFACGMVTPCVEMYRGLYHVIEQRTLKIPNDSIGTFDGQLQHYNFVMQNADTSFFYRYLAR